MLQIGYCAELKVIVCHLYVDEYRFKEQYHQLHLFECVISVIYCIIINLDKFHNFVPIEPRRKWCYCMHVPRGSVTWVLQSQSTKSNTGLSIRKAVQQAHNRHHLRFTSQLAATHPLYRKRPWVGYVGMNSPKHETFHVCYLCLQSRTHNQQFEAESTI